MDEATRDASFEARIAAGESVEPKDWMPARYRTQLIRMMSQHAHSEVVGMLPEGNWITRAPTLRRKIGLLSKVQDEGGHGLYLYAATETLGISRDEMTEALLDGSAKYSAMFNYPTPSWADIGAIGWLIDGAAIVNQTMLTDCSYGPYKRAMIRICKEENAHQRQGFEMITALARGSAVQREMAQEAVNRWYWPALTLFGPHDAESKNSAELTRWGIKHKSNDELRQWFMNRVVPQARAIDIEFPDAELHHDEASGNWIHGPIDWDEFRRVLAGSGPCNRDRIEARRRAHEEGRWVREAAAAYEAKRAGDAA